MVLLFLILYVPASEIIPYQHISVWRSTNQASVKYLRSPDTQIQLHAK